MLTCASSPATCSIPMSPKLAASIDGGNPKTKPKMNDPNKTPQNKTYVFEQPDRRPGLHH